MEMIMILVFSEKPAIMRCIAPLLISHYPSEQLVFINSLYIGNISSRYPHNLKWSEYPLSVQPQLKTRPWSYWHCKTNNAKGELIDMELTTTLLESAREFLFAGDPSGFPALSFDMLVNRHFSNKKIKLSAIRLYALDQKTVHEALSEKSDFYENMKDLLNYGKIRNYFTYNFNLNSFSILGVALSKIGIKEGFLSKYMLQLLYLLAKKPSLQNEVEGKVIHAMSHWKGTGKYIKKCEDVNFFRDHAQLGSMTSRITIIENLLKMQLLTRNLKASNLLLTDKAYALMDLLPKDCEDSDLPFRLHLWSQMDFPEAQVKMDIYLKTYFGKIKRKLNTV